MEPTLSIQRIKDSKWLLPGLLVVCLGLLYLNVIFGVVVSVVVIGIVVVVSSFCIAYWHPKYNIVVLLSVGFFVPFIMRAGHLYTIPIGVFNEITVLIILIAMLLKGNLSGGKTTPGMLILIWFGYEIVELINPYAASRIAGFHAIRNIITMVLTFFIMYSSVKKKSDINVFFYTFIFFGFLAAIYGLYQEFVGLPTFDYNWAHATEKRFQVLFTWGHLRKFSFFFSPSDFGLVMAYAGVLSVVLFFSSQIKPFFRILFILFGVCCFWSMIYTSSRTSMALIPVGFVMFTMISLKRNAMILIGTIILVSTGLMLKGVGGKNLMIMRTAFQADDPSLNVRLTNQQIIQSYIQTHPIGFGLGSTGYYGSRFSPHTFVGSFPPDSEYVKVAIESGWLGLFLWCTILAIIFGYAVKSYFNMKNKKWKDNYVAFVTLFFMIIVHQYPQELFHNPLFSILFSTVVAMIAKVPKIAPILPKIMTKEEFE